MIKISSLSFDFSSNDPQNLIGVNWVTKGIVVGIPQNVHAVSIQVSQKC